ncbi:serine/threonine protein kinase [Rhodococcus sp. ACPA1]|uniref:serine/threonine protein kinase n=1 Tax=Rhodococcus sp. ACPA1 TaxID=2028572 RepID=UPI0015CB4952|nr:serine/threonine protein kinase [Rhodococcus sp. ACPA1]
MTQTAGSAGARVGVEAGESPISFATHIVRAGGEMGARDDFETMIGQLVTAIHPGARMIAANPGDWGIDAFAGDMGGEIVVWQSKFFYPVVAEKHHQEIRDSFKSVCRQAGKQGHVLKQWILCVPSDMDGPTTKWWDGWKLRTQKAQGLSIDLWDANRLRSYLISPDAANVQRHYYGRVGQLAGTREVVSPAEERVEEMESALFVRQLKAAGHVEVGSAKRQFFNADLMAREIADKAVPSEVAALSEADAHVHMLWEDRFNDACLEAGDAALAGLHKSVMNDIRDAHDTITSRIKASRVHARGLMHRVVDDRRAGWVKDWRSVAEQHPASSQSPSAPRPSNAGTTTAVPHPASDSSDTSVGP